MRHVTTGPRDLQVAVGDTIELHLAENTSRDYTWCPTHIGKGLLLSDVRFVPSRNPLPGAGSERILYLRAKRAGTWPVSLQLQRAEHMPADERRMTVTVT